MQEFRLAPRLFGDRLGRSGLGWTMRGPALRIIQVIPAIAVEAAGPSYSVVRLCDSLIARGEEVELAALRWDENYSPPSYCREFPLSPGPRRLGRSSRMMRWLGEQAAAGRVDVLHSHALWEMPCVYPARVARASGVPLVASPRGSLAPAALRFSAFRKAVFWRLQQGPALRAAQVLHATSESELGDIRGAGFRQPVAVIPNGVDVPPPRFPGQRDGPRVLLYLGRIHPIKGLDSLLRAWQAVAPRHPDWELRIVGPGEPDHVADVRRLAQELRTTRVFFGEPAYGPQRLAAYRAAELYVLPTRSENFGMTVAEALAAGTPAIVTQGAPWSGLATHDAGWWVGHGLEPLVAALDEGLRASPSRLAAMGKNGRQWMIDSFDWTGIAGTMRSVYEWLCRGGARPGCIRE